MTFGYENTSELAIEYVPIDSVKEHPQNPRKHRVEMIARALQEFGQRSPIVVAKDTNFILKGNGTHKAAKMLGWGQIAVIWSELEGDAATAYMLSDNRPSDLATYDRKKLRDGLAAMVAGPGLNSTLWGEEEFEDLDEEFRGVATLPQTSSDDAGDGASAEAAPTAPKADPAKKMREVPFVFTAAEHALFMEWLSQLKTAFGTNDWKETVYEAIRRQAVAEGGGHVQTGIKAPEQVPGQVGLDEAIEAAVPTGMKEVPEVPAAITAFADEPVAAAGDWPF